MARRTVAILVVAVVAVAVLLIAVAAVVLPRLRTDALHEAIDRLPAATLRASFTDWDRVAEEVPGADVTASSSAADIDAWLEAAFDRDLTTVSALSDTFQGLAAAFDITPLDGEWEAYGQARDGSVDLLKLADEVSLDDLEARFADLGYEPPSSGKGKDGVWVGTPELVAGLDHPLRPTQENVAVVRSQRILVMSDSPDYVASTVQVVKGEEPSLGSVAAVPDLLDAAGDPTVAELWAGDFACADLSMSQADPADQTTGSDLVSAVGGVHPLTGLVMAQHPDLSLTVAMAFESSDQASADLQPRTDLASGPAPGQGGSFTDRFRVTSGTASGTVLTLELEPVDRPLLGDLGQGPLLFVTC